MDSLQKLYLVLELIAKSLYCMYISFATEHSRVVESTLTQVLFLLVNLVKQKCSLIFAVNLKYYLVISFSAHNLDNWCENALDLTIGKLIVESNLPFGTYCQWMISAVDDTHYVNLEFENLDVRIAELNNLAEAIGHSSARETNSMVSSARVIYDRVLNKKNYFEIPPFLCLNEESQEQENSNQC